ncbi:MAG: M48 family metalloprotease [Alphaproteobacteria bacterium]
MNTRWARFAGILLITVVLTLGSPAEGARFSLIRDAEIENTIRTYAAPLFKAAGLDADAVRVHLINDPGLNSFVAGGMQVFINTGLLMTAENPNQVIGVIAHETGHIAGGHLARANEALRGASVMAILAYVLGAATAVASGGKGAGAVIAGGQSLAQQTLLQYSRTQEQAADQFAVTVLDRTKQSSAGLARFLEILSHQEALFVGSQDPYLRTHPLTRDRINFVRHHVAVSPYSSRTEPAAWQEMFRRMQAKLVGFLMPPGRTFARYPESDTSIEARYARAIAHFRHADLVPALAEIDSLIAERPDDPFFHELKGQILFENGRVDDAVAPYRRAVALLPDAPLIRVGLARALIETGASDVLEEASRHLEAVVRRDRDNGSAWRLLSIAYGRTERPGLSALASAELGLLAGRYSEAVGFSKRAIKRLPFGSPGRLRAEDIEHAAKLAMKRAKENEN